MFSLDKKYARMLNGLSGTQLTEELRKVIAEIKGGTYHDQRTADRGSYLILENLGRVPDADQEELIRGMLEANPNPSRGVQSNLKGWRPKKMPAANTLAVIAGVIGVGLAECLGSVQDGAMSLELFNEIEKTLVAQDKLDTAAQLAGTFAPGRVADLTDRLMARVIEMFSEEVHAEATATKMSLEEWSEWEKSASEEERAAVHNQPNAFRIKCSRDRLFRSAVSLSIKHKTAAALARMRSSAELNHGDDLYHSDFVDAAVIVGDEKWLEAAIQHVIKLMRAQPCQGYDYRLAEQAFELVKEARFAGYGLQLFEAIYYGHISVQRGEYYEASFLKLLAEMAVHFQNASLQDRVYRAAMKEIPKGSYGHTAYEAIIVLAPVHEASRRTTETTPQPEWRMVLR